MGLGAMSTAGGLILVEQLHKKNPVAIALTSAAFGCTVGQSAEAGLAAGATSIAISGMDYCLSDNIKRDLSGNLPKCLTSEGAKITAQILIATTVGYYFGKEAQG